ncbi:MAG: type I-E CRISPR-associated endoribonuclease Cas2e [Acidobacteriota bacterium]|nr:type I-E CRISPR-associated endoribonuclease Cas2e [Blastocatellia bacterium]MDW8413231.1 type I-E CRISPR-associated endoribonuclease Cas2e [Acidobacteriota bacterium]
MLVIILEKVPASVRGELTRWMLEVKTGVFVGNLSALVQDTLWKMIKTKVKDGGAILICKAASEQGFSIEMFGDTSREVVNFDGLQLIRVRSASDEHKLS